MYAIDCLARSKELDSDTLVSSALRIFEWGPKGDIGGCRHRLTILRLSFPMLPTIIQCHCPLSHYRLFSVRASELLDVCLDPLHMLPMPYIASTLSMLLIA